MNPHRNRDIEPETDAAAATPSKSQGAESELRSPHTNQIKILFIAANGPQGDLQLDEEQRVIDRAVARRPDHLVLVTKFAVRRDELHLGLLEHRPAVVHFGGHGTRRGLLFRDRAGGLAEVSADAFRSLLEALRDDVRIVVLNACFSAAQAAAISDSTGIAIGMRRPISDPAAIAFSAAFYDALALGRSVRQAFDLGCAAIKAQGMADQADIPDLLVRPGLDASAVRLPPAPRTIPGDAVSGTASQTLRMVFGAALVAAVVLAVLFGLGVLRQNILSEYVVFVVLGGVAAIFTWGFLSAGPGAGETRQGIALRLIGSAITLAAVIAGGLWLAMSQGEFAIKIKFVNGAQRPIAVTGLARLEIGGYTSSVPVTRSDLVAFSQLPRRMDGIPASLTLESPGIALGSPDGKYRLHPDGMYVVEVRPVATPKLSGTVSFTDARMPGGRLSIVGYDCAGDIHDGFFEIPCDGLMAPVKVQVRVPELYVLQVCTRELVLPTLANNDVVLEGCKNAPKLDPPPPRLCIRTPEALIQREAQLVQQYADRNDLGRIVGLFTAGARITDAQTHQTSAPRERYQAELARHRFVEATHGDIRCVSTMDRTAYYTSSSAGRLLDGTSYNNPGSSDHWVLEKQGGCWQIASLTINAAHDGDQRFASRE
jgi:hypothetical protein